MFYACFLGPLRLTYPRYGSPLVPALTAGGGIAAALLIERLSVRIPRWAGAGNRGPAGARSAHGAAGCVRPADGPSRHARSGAGLAGSPRCRPGRLDGRALRAGARRRSSVAAVCRQELPGALWRPVPVLLAPTAPLAPAPGEFESTVNPRYLPVRLSNAPAPAGQGEAGWERIGFLGAQRFVIWEYDQRAALTDLHAPSAPDFLSRRGTAGHRLGGGTERPWQADRSLLDAGGQLLPRSARRGDLGHVRRIPGPVQRFCSNGPTGPADFDLQKRLQGANGAMMPPTAVSFGAAWWRAR